LRRLHAVVHPAHGGGPGQHQGRVQGRRAAGDPPQARGGEAEADPDQRRQVMPKPTAKATKAKAGAGRTSKGRPAPTSPSSGTKMLNVKSMRVRDLVRRLDGSEAQVGGLASTDIALARK